MHWQALITTLLVAGCAAYAAWSAMPSVWRRRLAAMLGRTAVAPVATGGCGSCDGCSGAQPTVRRDAAAGMAGVSVIHIVRKPPGV